jgi:hypothetical protein
MTPDRTYFEAKYQPRVNRSSETFEVPFDNQGVTFGTTGRCTIPVKGDYLTRLTLRSVFPPIYPTVTGEYIFPTPSSQVGGSVYANMGLTLVVADGVTLTANTVGNHYMSIGAAVTLSGTAYRIFDLDGTYTVVSIPTANSFTCSTTLAGISYNGTMSFVGIVCGDIISYFSTRNSNLWVNNLTNKTWQITSGSNVGTNWTFTTSAPSNFPVGSQVLLNLPSSGYLNTTAIVTSTSDTTFTSTINGRFVSATDNNQIYSSDGLTWYKIPSPLSGAWSGVAYGNGVFVMVGANTQAYSTDNGVSWTNVASPLSGSWLSVTYGNGVFVMVGYYNQAYSTNNGLTWNPVTSPVGGDWTGVTYGNGVFVMVSFDDKQAYSTTNGLSWTPVVTPVPGYWQSVAYSYVNGRFVMVDSVNYQSAYSTTLGVSWIIVSSNPYYGVTFGNNIFVAVGNNNIPSYSTNGLTWTQSTSSPSGAWWSVSYGNGTFVMTADLGIQAYSTDNAVTWKYATTQVSGNWHTVSYGDFSYTSSQSDSVSLVVPPLQLSNRVFSSNTYPSISFANASDAAFWGFDARNGLSYSLTATPPWTLTQSGWVSGFLPPSTSTWDDSVAHKLVRDARILVGKQTIKEYSGEYIELQNDLTVPYENKAILKLLNGTLDQTQATAAREYYTTLPLGTREIPLCALTHQQMSVEIDFEAFTNLSQNLNPGTGDFLNPQSYTTYNASTGILNGQPVNVQTTFSYQQYIFIVTYGGQFIVYDTTKDVADPTSYIVLSAFSGTSLFSQFCVLSGTLYIGLSDGTLASINISELIQGNISSFATNNYEPTVGSLTGTVVADFRYVYYTVSNTASSNVFLSRYDTTGSFTSPGSYTVVDFTKTFNSNVTGVYQTLSTGTQLFMLPQGTPGSLYTYQLNSNVQSQWYMLDYSSSGAYQITESVLIGNTLYFVCDGFNILKYTNSTFTLTGYLNPVIVMGGITLPQQFGYSINNGFNWGITGISNPVTYIYTVAFGNNTFVVPNAVSTRPRYSTDYGRTWNLSTGTAPGTGVGMAFGNNRFVMVGTNKQAYSVDNGRTWTVTTPLSGTWYGVTYGNGVFVMVGTNKQAYSINNGLTWINVGSPRTGSWTNVTYGNGVFVMVGNDVQAYSTDNGLSWTSVASPLVGGWSGLAYGNGFFVAVGSSGNQAYSTNNGLSWVTVTSPLSGAWYGVTYVSNSLFVMVGQDKQARSTDNGLTWTISSIAIGNWYDVASSPPRISGTGFKNLIAVGNYIYASTGNVAVQIDTTQDLSTAAAYKFPAPVLPDGQYVFANGPRYVYMFSQSDPLAQNIVRFDPYPPTPFLKTSILVDYESLPEGTKKPDKALIGLVQTQKVLDMNYMNIRGPVKELWVTGVSDSANVFQYSNLAARSTLTLTGEKIVTEDDGTHTFLNIIEPFETHTSMPIRNVSVISFELDPESEIPNGTVNFSRIRDQIFEGGAQTVWARNYNLLAIQGGIGGLIFNS